MKKLNLSPLHVFLFLMLLSLSSLSQVTSLPGSGTSDDPYLINSVGELKWMRDQVNLDYVNYGDKYYKLTNDLDFTGEEDWIPIAKIPFNFGFKGQFDGNNHRIIHIRIGSELNPVEDRLGGFFGYIDSGYVFNLGIFWDGIYITHSEYDATAGGIVSILYKGLVSGCSASGNISAISSVWAYSGGIVGSSVHGLIINSFATGNIFSHTIGSPAWAGGIAGYNFGGSSIINCYATGDISATSEYSNCWAGGIAGSSSGFVTNCYSNGNISTFCLFGATSLSLGGGIVGFCDTGPYMDANGNGNSTCVVKKCLALNKKIVSISSNVNRALPRRIGYDYYHNATYSSNFATTKINVSSGDSQTNLKEISDFGGVENGTTLGNDQLPVSLLNEYAEQNPYFDSIPVLIQKFIPDSIPLLRWKVDSMANFGLPIFVNQYVNHRPVSLTGPDQTVYEGELITLDGSFSNDPDNDSISYSWTSPDGIILNSSSDQKPVFPAPEVKQDTTLTFTLVVNDGFLDSDPSKVNITIKNFIKTGLETVPKNVIKVYPNPIGNELIIEYKGNTKKSDFEIINSIGQVVYKGDIVEKAVVHTELFSPGIYLIKLKTGDIVEFKKILKN